MVAALRKAGVVVVDISAEFRLRRMEDYETWYGTHGAPELFGQGVYGLPEVYADELAGAELVAAPGCYPTSALLPMLPLLRADFVGAAPVVVDAKSGVSGAGRTLDEGFLFAELDENARAYKVAMHRHGVEIEQEASRAAGRAVGVTFVPHLIPTIRGIVAACYLQPTRSVELAEAHALLAEAYADAPFVRVLPPGDSPALASVRGSNYCDVAVHVDERNGTLVALAAIDNLVKGAGGQGIQCPQPDPGLGRARGPGRGAARAVGATRPRARNRFPASRDGASWRPCWRSRAVASRGQACVPPIASR